MSTQLYLQDAPLTVSSANITISTPEPTITASWSSATMAAANSHAYKMIGEGDFVHKEMDDTEQVPIVAAWMDVRYPGWAEQIDLDKLDLTCNYRCIAGQLGMHWTAVRRQFHDDHGWLPRTMLTTGRNEWIEQVRERVKQPVPA